MTLSSRQQGMLVGLAFGLVAFGMLAATEFEMGNGWSGLAALAVKLAVGIALGLLAQAVWRRARAR